MEALTTFRSGFRLSRALSTNLPVFASLRPLYPPNRYEASPHLSQAASRNALRASVYRSQRSSTCSTVSSPRPHSHTGLSASFFLNRQALSPQCSVRACTKMDALSEDSAPYERSVCLPDQALSIFHVWYFTQISSRTKSKFVLRFYTCRATPWVALARLGKSELTCCTSVLVHTMSLTTSSKRCVSSGKGVFSAREERYTMCATPRPIIDLVPIARRQRYDSLKADTRSSYNFAGNFSVRFDEFLAWAPR
jgi:hypothetical protein